MIAYGLLDNVIAKKLKKIEEKTIYELAREHLRLQRLMGLSFFACGEEF